MKHLTVGKYREEYLDWICGLMILQMIFWHIIGHSHSDALLPYTNVLSFYMSWFFFKSGMFFKKAENEKQYITKQSKRLLTPFFLFSAIGFSISLIYYLLLHRDLNWHYYAGLLFSMLKCGHLGSGPLWYLFSLWLIKVTCNSLKLSIWYILPITAIIPAVMYYSGFNNWHFLSHTMMGAFFFVCGNKLHQLQFNKYFFIASLMIFAFCLLYLHEPVHIQMYSNQLRSGVYVMNIPYSLSAIILLNNIIKITPPNC